MKLFLLGSCRIHRPFNCEKKHTEGKYNLYNCLNTKWHEQFFLGSIYCSHYIIQTLRCLINKDINNKEIIQTKDPQVNIDNTQFLKLCETLYEADIFIIEIATIKYITNNNIYISNEHKHKYKSNKHKILTEEELNNNIQIIEKLIEGIGKKVLFISHFNINNVYNRKIIIDCLKKNAKYFFDPSEFIDNMNNLDDINHYTLDTEKIIMDEIHNYLSTQFKRHMC
jgi:hypothetical protein